MLELMVSLNRRFNMVFILLVALPLLLVGLLLSLSYMNALIDTVSGQAQDLLEQIAQNVEKELNTASVLAATLRYDKELSAAAISWSDSPPGSRRIQSAGRILERLNSIFTISNRTGVIAVYMKDGTVLETVNYPNLNSRAMVGSATYLEAKASPDRVVIAENLSGMSANGGERFVLSAAIAPGDGQTTGIDAILLMFRIPYLDQISVPPLPDSRTGLIILGRDGNALLSDFTGTLTDSELSRIRKLNRGNAELRLRDTSYLVNSRTLETSGWTFLLTMEKSSITSRIMAYQWYLYPALALMLGLFLVYSMVFFSRVSRPIHAVIENMRRFTLGQDPLPVGAEGIAELAALGANFESMVTEIRRLDHEREQQSKQRLAAEIRALQFQINPHFVANTLNSIRMMALAARNDAIRDMTQALIRILADSYASADPMTTLENEVENIRNYLAIMKVRFGEHFLVRFDLAPESLDCRVLRMSLQPLVENAILHGFAGLSRQGHLTIASRLSGSAVLEIEVQDNGVGMDPEQCRSLLAKHGEPESLHSGGEAPTEGPGIDGLHRPGGTNHIGIRNVHDRIRLHFGPDYGLDITSQPECGTTVRIILPLMRGH